MKEKQVNLVDLLVDVLLNWRRIIICMLVGAVLFGVFGYLRAYQASNAKVKNAKEQLEIEKMESYNNQTSEIEWTGDVTFQEFLEVNMTDQQIRSVKYVISQEKILEDTLLYQEQSIMMKLDPNNVNRSELTFYVSSDDLQRSHDIEKAYEDIVRSGETIEYIAQKINSEAININEGISLGRSTSGMLEDTNTFRIVIIHYNKSDCLTMAQAFIELINKKHDDLVDILGPHEITAVNQSFAIVTDPSVLKHQKSYLGDIDSLQNTIVNNKAKFSAAEWDYYDFLVNGELTGLSSEKIVLSKTEEEIEREQRIQSLENVISNGVSANLSIRHVFLGMILAAVLYSFVVFVVFILNTKLRSTDCLQDLYNIPQLGLISQRERPKKPFDFIDNWILYLRNRNKRKFIHEDALKLAVVATKMAALRESFDEIYIIGCVLEGYALEVCETIQRELKKDKIQVNILNNVIYDAQAMWKLEKAKGVVLVELVGSTLYAEIAQELSLLDRQNIKVLGGIVVE